MLNRRLVRIKVFQSLYSWLQDEQAVRSFYEKQLLLSLHNIYDYYYFVLAFPLDLKHLATLELETEKNKHFPSTEEISFLESISGNRFIELMEQHKDFRSKLAKKKISWEPYHEILKNIFGDLKKDATFREHALKAERTLADDRKTIQYMLNLLATENELFNHQMEDLNIHWQDDKEAIMNAVNKSMRLLKDDKIDFLNAPDDEYSELETFARDLYNKSLQHDEELTGLITNKTKNWDFERIAVSDTLLLKMALCEILYFPSIPVKVSINEYLEISKLYSTPNSKNFINGVLDAIQKELRSTDSIFKEGRGLME